jgi:hypothetical protein
MKSLFLLCAFLCGCISTPSGPGAESVPLDAKQALLLAIKSFDQGKFGPIQKFTISTHDMPETSADHFFVQF